MTTGAATQQAVYKSQITTPGGISSTPSAPKTPDTQKKTPGIPAIGTPPGGSSKPGTPRAETETAMKKEDVSTATTEKPPTPGSKIATKMSESEAEEEKIVDVKDFAKEQTSDDEGGSEPSKEAKSPSKQGPPKKAKLGKEGKVKKTPKGKDSKKVKEEDAPVVAATEEKPPEEETEEIDEAEAQKALQKELKDQLGG